MTDLALRTWVGSQIAARLDAVIPKSQESEVARWLLRYPQHWRNIQQGVELKRVPGVRGVAYAWAIAPTLPKRIRQAVPGFAHTAQDCAAMLVQLLRGAPDLEDADSDWMDCQLVVRPSGVLQVWVGDRALMHWIQRMQTSACPVPALLASSPSVPDPEMLCDPDWFPVQAAHARCCALLRLGMREQRIQLADAYTAWPRLLADFGEPLPLPLEADAVWALVDGCVRGWDALAEGDRLPTDTLCAMGQCLATAVWQVDATYQVLDPVLSVAHQTVCLILLAQRCLGWLLAVAGQFAPATL